MNNRLLLATAACGWVLSASAFAEETLWVTDFAKAKQTAAAEGKDLLMDFTGSDWCGWCIKLRKEVFDQEAFKTAAPKNFVLVEIDYPRDKSKLSKEVQEQNQTLKGQFAVRGYPTILLADATGRPYANTGYEEGGPEAYLTNLDGLRAVKTKRDAAWKKAESAAGVEKAKLLAEGLNAVDSELAATYYKPVIDEIIQLDPKDETGVGAGFGLKADIAALKAKLATVARSGEAGAARKEIDAFMEAHPKATPQQKQEVLMVLLSTYTPPKDNDNAIKLMEEVKALDPESETGLTAQKIIGRIQKK